MKMLLSWKAIAFELDLPNEIKDLIKEKIQICKDDKTE